MLLPPHRGRVVHCLFLAPGAFSLFPQVPLALSLPLYTLVLCSTASPFQLAALAFSFSFFFLVFSPFLFVYRAPELRIGIRSVRVQICTYLHTLYTFSEATAHTVRHSKVVCPPNALWRTTSRRTRPTSAQSLGFCPRRRSHFALVPFRNIFRQPRSNAPHMSTAVRSPFLPASSLLLFPSRVTFPQPAL